MDITQTGPFAILIDPISITRCPQSAFHNHFHPGPRVFALGLFIPNGDLISPILTTKTPGSLTGAMTTLFCSACEI